MADDGFKLFGFSLGTKREEEARRKNTPITFSPPMDNDGAAVVESNGSTPGSFYGYGLGGFMASAINIAGPVKDEIAAIRKYRQMAQHHDCDAAIDDIVNESIVYIEDNDDIVWLNVDKLEASQKVKDVLAEEFSNVLDLLDFNANAYDIFRAWYVDGRLYYHKIPNKDNPKQGLSAVRRIDPLLMKKVREVVRTPHPADSKLKIIKEIREYFVFNEQGSAGEISQVGSKIAPEAITFIHSGTMDPLNKTIVSYLDKAYRPLNQVRMIEDALVIYRMARAPERRVFNVDVGNLPPIRAEQYVRDLMNQYRNRLVYDASTGQIQDNAHHMHILEDFWLPKGQGGTGTTVSSLQGGMNLDQIADMEYFQKLFYKALNVPMSRMEQDRGVSLARASEISRDEIKFSKFIKRLQRRFAILFLDILKTQLLLKGLVSNEEWVKYSKKIFVEYAKDNHFAEAIELDLLDGRMNAFNQLKPLIGTYYSEKHVRNVYLKQTDEMIEQMNKEIQAERHAAALQDFEDKDVLPTPAPEELFTRYKGDVDYDSNNTKLPKKVTDFLEERKDKLEMMIGAVPPPEEGGEDMGGGSESSGDASGDSSSQSVTVPSQPDEIDDMNRDPSEMPR